jgi:presenilin-like A22 family membrane protease
MKSAFILIGIFLIIQILGLYIGYIYNQAIKAEELPAPEIIPGVSSESVENSFYLFGYIIITTIGILLVIKVRKSFLRGIEAIVVFIASWFTFDFLIPIPVGDLSIGFFLALILTAWKVFRPSILNQDIAAIFSGAGVGALLGTSLGILPSIIFIIILSAYDFVSVFITKHMVKMAKAIIERPMAFTIAAPHQFKKATYVPVKGSKKKVHIFQLGLGDVIIPLMFSVSILSKYTIMNSIITMVGSLAGLLFLIFYITRKPQALPALPFISLGTLAAFVISIFVV